MFDKILTWSSLSPERRLSVILGAVIVSLVHVVLLQRSEIRDCGKDHRKDIKRMQEELNQSKDRELLYFQQMSQDYLKWLKELNNLKNKSKKNESINN